VIIRRLAILFFIPSLVFATDIPGSTSSGIEQFTNAYEAWDGKGFAAAAATFAKAPEDATSAYWRGTAEFHSMLYFLGEPDNASNRQAAKQALECTIEALQQAIKLNPKDGESHALLGTAYGLSIADSPGRALWLGPRLMKAAELAHTLNPESPRVWYLDGMSRFYGPALLGGKSEALRQLLAAEKLFAAEAGKPPVPGEPRWGRSSCLVYIGRTYDALDKPAEALAYYRKALQVNSNDRLAKVELENRKQ